MSLLLTSFWMEVYLLLLLAVSSYYLYFKLVTANYWKVRNVPHEEPVFLLGHLWKASIQKNLAILISDLHRKWKREKLVGIFSFTTPVLVITDVQLVKNILVRDFGSFQSHGFSLDFEREPLAGHLFNLSGAKWRNLRVKLTPTFTSGKMKMMFPTMAECGKQLRDHLRKASENKIPVEVKDTMARFTTDIISSCAFGIESNSLRNPDSEFRRYGKKIFEPTLTQVLIGLVFNSCPKLFHFLKLRTIPNDVSEFFLSAVKETMDYREKNNVRRNDFMQLLIQLKSKGKLDEVDDIDSAAVPEENDGLAQDRDMKFSFNEAAAQAFVFFAAGFETSSTTLTFALYEIALNPDVMKTLQEELDRILKKNDREITYESIAELEYLDWTVQETLRKYPPLGFLMRKCNQDYHVPEKGVTIEKGTQVFISALGIHRDPEFFPEPDKFDPTRFSPEEKAKRNQYPFLAFGEGPRFCIGNRFGLLQTKIGLASLLSCYDVGVSKETPIPLKFNVQSFILTPEEEIFLTFDPRQ